MPEPLPVGAIAPDFTANTQDGQSVHLADLRGKYVVLIFYPGDDTPTCTTQLCEIRDSYEGFKSKNAVVFGINQGSREKHQKFVDHHKFPFPLIVRGAPLARKYNSAFLGFIARRTVYVIDPQGKIVFSQRGKPPVSAILAAIE